ncbi:thioesterase family protein [Aliiruegeria lutimaris]|uniref:Fluoroacetyl-CoA thioesterase n=1 Tax=Aliiruegeria lutimaris TaxID=571298 RepID=A0A1G8J5U1_9RHOB|nr:thioesterase family protein [Aliiruegeria lutimaris]SDI26403.1 fluoroacetyl-CoA thioesterase [Aliiruegeria lutimaris]
MKPGLVIGDKARFARAVRPEEVVCRLFPDARIMDDMPEVFASAMMIGMFEWACVEQIAPFYEQGEGSLGIGFDLNHVAPTPPGLTVTVETEVIEIDGRFITFRVRGHDGQDMIGEGTHKRAVTRWEKFNAKVAAKAAKAHLERTES